MHKIVLTLLVLSTLMASCHGQSTGDKSQPIAVIELFTSEGCSSCPPADKLLAKYGQEASYSGVKIFPLAFHVDYWNHLGWRDSFSSAGNTERQRMYVDALGLSGAYTPQMIVNGMAQFVGSDEQALRTSLSEAAKTKNTVSFNHLTMTNENDKLRVQYQLQGDVKGCAIHFALVSLQVATSVKRGENTGRKLSHTNVVRQFITTTAATSGSAAFENISFLTPDNTAIIAYIQRLDDLRIIAAAKTK